MTCLIPNELPRAFFLSFHNDDDCLTHTHSHSLLPGKVAEKHETENSVAPLQNALLDKL